MRYGSLFSGGGGLDVAVRGVFGAECAWHCEYDEAASKVLTAHWPDVPNLHDVTAVDWSTTEPVDIMCGGYPCQPFSAAGQRKGTDDDRHLWPYFAEAIRRIRPRYVVLENVAGHRSMGFDSVLGDLATLGYDAQWCSIRASDVGAPHRRERLFALATDTTSVGRGSWWTEPAGLEGRLDVAISGASDVALLPTPSAADGAGGHLNRSGARSGELLLPGLAKAYATGVLQHPRGWGKYAPAVHQWEAVTCSPPSPIELNSKGNPQLAPAFSEWMMGWPLGWVTAVEGLSRNDQLRIIGNGVVTLQAVAALRWLLAVSEYPVAV